MERAITETGMCGIAGYLNVDKSPAKDSSTILSMIRIQKHRGPDDSGIQAFSLTTGKSVEMPTGPAISVDKEFEGMLGFNRLSILDLSENGHQPMVSPDGKVLLTLNGEIYNAFDFKAGLQSWGYVFRSTSDTEVVLALYLRYGFTGMLERLNGMFAIVIIDLGKQELFMARDRFGIKPMYYLLNNRTFAFSSELKSFKFIENFNFRLRMDQLNEYLLYRNNIEGTLYKEIESLEPGSYISYRHDTGMIKRKYFSINDFSRETAREETLEYYKEKIKQWLGKSVRSQLMSDVRLGCQLSGGIDSSLVTWLANEDSKTGNFEAVSIIFRNKAYSEENYIDEVTSLLKIPSHKFLLDSEYYLDNIEKASWHLESPLNHPNTVAIYRLSQRAKEFVTVLLSGEGADEVFGGYTRFYDIKYPYRLRKLRGELRKNMLNPSGYAKYLSGDYRAIMATAFMTLPLAKKLRPGFNERSAYEKRKSLYQSLSGSPFDKQVKYELISYLPDLLIRQDKMSMAHSIENRVPFLDNELVANSFTVPEEYLLLRKSAEGYNNEKYLLKRMAADTFGGDFAFRDKMGFGIPLKEFFENRKFDEYLYDKILPGIRSRGLFNSDPVKKWLSDISRLNYAEMEALWVIVAFEIWASIYLDSNHENWNTSI